MSNKRSSLIFKDALTKARYRRGTRNSDSAARDCTERTDHGLIQTIRWPKPHSLETQKKYAEVLQRRFVPKGEKR